MRACPACHNKKTEEYYSITDLPLLLFPVDYAVKSQIKSDNITSFKCAECYHVFTDPLEDRYSKLIYEEYYRYYPFENLESMGAAYRKPFEKFFEDTLLKSNKFNFNIKSGDIIGERGPNSL